MTKNKVNLHIYYMSTVYTNIKNKKLTVETNNTKFPYGTGNKESGGEVVAKFESTKLLQVCSVCNLASSNIYY
jgi:hypothetical protein